MKKTQYSNTPAAESLSFPADKPARTGLPWIGPWREGLSAVAGVRKAGKRKMGRLIRSIP
jgi:hypothetical protein